MGKIGINPLSYICLGPDNAYGIRFYARQVLPENAGNFHEEFEYLNDKADYFEEKNRKVEKMVRSCKWIVLFINILIILVSFFGPKLIVGTDEDGQPIPLIGVESNFMLLRFSTIASMFISVLFDASASYKRIERERKAFSQCPNPDCTHVLMIPEIREYRCAACKNVMKKKTGEATKR